MLEVKGKYNTAKIFTDVVDEASVAQVIELCNQQFCEDSRIRLMPDIHAGAGCTVGTTMTITDKVVPNLVGVDIGCFTGDTVVPLIDGTQRSLKNLANETESFYVYSMDDDDVITAAKATCQLTRKNAKLVKVTISGGAEIICTEDHKFMCRDKSYKEAKALNCLDSLMPLYRTYQTRDGYESIIQPIRKDVPKCTHKLIAKQFICEDLSELVVHHKNGNQFDNRPDNLEVLTAQEHSKYHASKTEKAARLKSKAFKEDRLKTLPAKGFYNERFKIKNNNEDILKWKIESKLFNNHKVISVEKMDDTEDVYCLTVEKWHNFALAAGVFVHNCGMETIRIREQHIELQKLDKLIYKAIPSGFSIREKTHRYFGQIDLESLYCFKQINHIRAEKSLGTLGGGNHFIEADKDEEGNIYLVVHSGSRHLGLEAANYYQNEGYKVLNGNSKQDEVNLVAALKAQGREKDIQKEIKKLKNVKQTNIPKPLAYVSGELFEQYIHDMKIVQQFAALNRKAMIDEIVNGMGVHVEEQFTTIHNYIDTDTMILRKGAVSAKAGEQLLIPINMRDGSLVCVGKGNEDWNCSAPHGAGRLMSRSAAKQAFTVSEFKKQMTEVFTTSVGSATLDECPMAYKNMSDIVDNISDTAAIVKIIKPIYNFKAGDES